MEDQAARPLALSTRCGLRAQKGTLGCPQGGQVEILLGPTISIRCWVGRKSAPSLVPRFQGRQVEILSGPTISIRCCVGR